jgi:hypothetical protein
MTRRHDNISTVVKRVGFTLQVSKEDYVTQYKKAMVIASLERHISTFFPDGFRNKRSYSPKDILHNFYMDGKTEAEQD